RLGMAREPEPRRGRRPHGKRMTENRRQEFWNAAACSAAADRQDKSLSVLSVCIRNLHSPEAPEMSAGERKRPRVDPFYEGEPHLLPKTKEWFDDYKRWVAEGCPTPEEEAARRAAGIELGAPFAQWLGKNPTPDLQELVAHYGSYDKIPPEAWAEYDKAMT